MTETKTLERTRPTEQSLSAAASLEHLTGGARGTVTWLHGATAAIALAGNTSIRVEPSNGSAAESDIIAKFHRSDAGYVLEATDKDTIWVNGRAAGVRPLSNGDMIEFGDDGPLSRFRLHRDGRCARRTFGEIVGDARDYLSVSRQPWPQRLSRAALTVTRRLWVETTSLFRISVIGVLLALVAFSYQQHRMNTQLQTALADSDTRLERVSAALVRTQKNALRPADLKTLREEFAQRLSSQRNRLNVLEDRPGLAGRIIAAAAPSVVFLQGAYGFRQRDSGRMLRYVLGATGRPILSPFGQPMLSPEGDGPIAELQFVGTGFVLAGSNLIVSNRHVALPWENESGAPLAARAELEPVMVRFHGYLPGEPTPIDLQTLMASDDADLALIRTAHGETLDAPGLTLADTHAKTGDEVIVMGYPTGLRSMLAQSGDAFVEDLQNDEITDFWEVAARLADGGYIAPLSSRGIIGQITSAAFVYDADTTHGGSGGPVLDAEGRVIAVNAAILPEYGGANIGVPAARLRQLIDGVGG